MNAFSADQILVLEDDADLRLVLSLRLARDGFGVMTAATAEEARDLVRRCGLPSLAIVDIGLPGASGLDFCRGLHRTSDLPVIMLTAVDDSDTIVRALSECAEDYMVKPVRLEELVARVWRVLRRVPSVAETVLVGTQEVCVDFGTGRATRGSQSVDLTPTESRILNVLISHAGTTVSVRQLVQRLWPEDEAPQETLRVHMSRLRAKLRRLDVGADLIETERNLGYRVPRALVATRRTVALGERRT